MAGAAAARGFACSSDGTRWIVKGALTFADAAPVLAAARTLPLPASGVVDCAAVAAVDSAAVAVLLALTRGATARGAKLDFANLPAPLLSLASLYGVEEIIGG
jgi:phospholipid transport system transporter-binding protein